MYHAVPHAVRFCHRVVTGRIRLLRCPPLVCNTFRLWLKMVRHGLVDLTVMDRAETESVWYHKAMTSVLHAEWIVHSLREPDLAAASEMLIDLWRGSYGDRLTFENTTTLTLHHAEAIVAACPSVRSLVSNMEAQSLSIPGSAFNHLVYALCVPLVDAPIDVQMEVAQRLLSTRLTSWSVAVPPLLAHALLCTEADDDDRDLRKSQVSYWREHMQAEHRIVCVHRRMEHRFPWVATWFGWFCLFAQYAEATEMDQLHPRDAVPTDPCQRQRHQNAGECPSGVELVTAALAAAENQAPWWPPGPAGWQLLCNAANVLTTVVFFFKTRPCMLLPVASIVPGHPPHLCRVLSRHHHHLARHRCAATERSAAKSIDDVRCSFSVLEPRDRRGAELPPVDAGRRRPGETGGGVVDGCAVRCTATHMTAVRRTPACHLDGSEGPRAAVA